MKELSDVNNGFMATKQKEEVEELTAEDVVANTLKSIKADKQKNEHPLSAGIFGVNGMNIFSQQEGQQLLAQSSAFAQAINNGENVVEDSDKWIQSLAEQTSKS